MSQSITIAGKPFEFTPRYAEGHTLNANEASALNQTLAENLRNNFATRAKEGAEQADFDAYAAAYQFGVRTGGTRSGDPVAAEAMNIAREMIRTAIRNDPAKKLSDYAGSVISDAAGKLLNGPRGEAIRSQAAARVEEARRAAAESIDGDILEGLSEASPAPSEEAPAKRKRAAAE